VPTRSDLYSKVSGPVAHELSALPLRFLLEQSVLASRGALSLFTELPMKMSSRKLGVIGNRFDNFVVCGHCHYKSKP
jgi:hypothetical protein